MRIAWTIEPTPAVVGPATLALTVQSASGEPLDDATVRVEGHMTHPGMTPIVVTATRQGHGRYEARFAFTMHGDWVLLVSAARPNGSRVERRIDVRDVRPPG